MNTYDLTGKRAVVTGGAQGIGRAVAERFIASGATVTIWDFDRSLGEQMCAETGASMVNPNLTDWDAVKSAAARTHAGSKPARGAAHKRGAGAPALE